MSKRKAIKAEVIEKALTTVRKFLRSSNSVIAESGVIISIIPTKYGELTIVCRTKVTELKAYVFFFYATGVLRKLNDHMWQD